MNAFTPFLMLTVPGLIAVSLHNKKLINVTRENWQRLLWQYLLYSYAIVLSANAVLYLTNPKRSVSFSASVISTTSNILYSSFIIKYSIVAVAAAFVLTGLWKLTPKIRKFVDRSKTFTIGKDE